MRALFALCAALLIASVARAHDIGHVTVPDCACDAACFTDEVSNLTCDERDFRFNSRGLPDSTHTLMRGITGSNQQFPTAHDLTFRIIRDPRLAANPTPTRAGPIGVAVNGVPIFDPSTQGPVQAATGKPVSAAAAGELDVCGGHAGRGDDYHYHRAPNCLIEDLGRSAIDDLNRPIGFAADGFPILALGWFDPANDIEDRLDPCRGASDTRGRYFYNVEHGGDYAVLTCFSGTERGFARDNTPFRRDASGRVIIGLPIHFTIARAYDQTVGGSSCHVMTGTLRDEQVLPASGSATRIRPTEGAVFYCDPGCYGHFVEVRKSGRGGRTVTFDLETGTCPAGFVPATDNAFLAFHRAGAELIHESDRQPAPRSAPRSANGPGPRDGKGPPPPPPHRGRERGELP